MKMQDILNEMLKCSSEAEAHALAICFTNIDVDTNQHTGFAVGLLERDPRLEKIESVLVPVDPDWFNKHGMDSGLEAHRMYRLAELPVTKFKPILFAHYEKENEHLLIDGRHRMAVACAKRAPLILAKIIPESIWHDYVVEDIPQTTPEELQASFSNIP